MDGYRFTTFRPQEGDTTSIGTSAIAAFHEDAGGNIWVGGSAWIPQGVSRYDPKTEQFTNYKHEQGNANSLIHDGVFSIFSARHDPDIIWISARETGPIKDQGGLSRLDMKTGTFTNYWLDSSNEHTTPFAISSMLEDSQGTLWGAGWGIHRFETDVMAGLPESDRLFTSFAPFDAEYLEENYINVLYEAPSENGVLWAGSRRGLHRFDQKTGSFTTFFPAPDDHQNVGMNFISAIHEDKYGTLWVATWSGLLRFDRTTGEFSVFEHQPSNKIISDISEDQFGSLWISHKNGLMKIERRVSPFQVYLANPDQTSQNRIFGIYTDIENRIWISQPDNLTRIDRNTSEVTFYPELTSHDVYEDRAGTYWIVSCRLGIRSFDPDTPERYFDYQPYLADIKTPGFFCPNSPLEDTAGNFWIPTWGSGLLQLDRKTNTFTQYLNDPGDQNSLASDQILMAFEAPSSPGVIWLGSEAGLTRFDPDSHQFTFYFLDELRRIMMIHEDTEGKFWVATASTGLHRFDPKTGFMERSYTTDDGLASNFIYSILPDNLGHFWLSTDNGLSRFDPVTDSFVNYTERDGLPGNQFSEHAHFKTKNGELFFGGINGLVSFYPDQITSNPTPPEVLLTSFRLAGTSVTPDPDGPLKASISHSENIVLPYNSNDIGFDFVALHSIDPEQNRYRYQLKGYDSDWIDAGDQRTARYPRLEPGEYTFQVIAASSDGVWNEEGASINISIRPPWWRTRSMFLVYGFLFMVGIYGIDRVQRRRLLRAAREKARERELAHAEEIQTAHTKLQQAHESLKSTQQQLIQQEKMASLGQLTSGIAHEIKNPLNFVNNFAELNTELLNELESNPNSRIGDVLETIHAAKINAQQIAKHGKRADRIVQSMMEHAGGKGERYEVAINPLVEEFTNLTYSSLQARIPDLEVEIEKELDEQVGSLVIAPQEIGRVLQNILGNAFEAVHDKSTRAGGDYVPRVHITTVHRENTVEIRISDNGVGIPQQALDRVFEPFFTTKPTGSGTGLGLSLSYDIVTQGHGGSLEVASTEGEGATFVVRLPAGS